MDAQKITVTVTVTALSIDTVPHMLTEAAQNIQREFINGKVGASDGDTVEWSTKSEPVTI
jgi:hypothetical protein